MPNHPHRLNVDRARRQIARHADEYTPGAVPAFRPPGPLKLPYLRMSREQADATKAKLSEACAPIRQMRDQLVNNPPDFGGFLVPSMIRTPVTPVKVDLSPLADAYNRMRQRT